MFYTFSADPKSSKMMATAFDADIRMNETSPLPPSSLPTAPDTTPALDADGIGPGVETVLQTEGTSLQTVGTPPLQTDTSTGESAPKNMGDREEASKIRETNNGEEVKRGRKRKTPTKTQTRASGDTLQSIT